MFDTISQLQQNYSHFLNLPQVEKMLKIFHGDAITLNLLDLATSRTNTSDFFPNKIIPISQIFH